MIDLLLLDISVLIFTLCAGILKAFLKNKPPCQQMVYDLVVMNCLNYCLAYIWWEGLLANLNCFISFNETVALISAGIALLLTLMTLLHFLTFFVTRYLTIFHTYILDYFEDACLKFTIQMCILIVAIILEIIQMFILASLSEMTQFNWLMGNYSQSPNVGPFPQVLIIANVLIVLLVQTTIEWTTRNDPHGFSFKMNQLPTSIQVRQNSIANSIASEFSAIGFIQNNATTTAQPNSIQNRKSILNHERLWNGIWALFMFVPLLEMFLLDNTVESHTTMLTCIIIILDTNLALSIVKNNKIKSFVLRRLKPT